MRIFQLAVLGHHTYLLQCEIWSLTIYPVVVLFPMHHHLLTHRMVRTPHLTLVTDTQVTIFDSTILSPVSALFCIFHYIPLSIVSVIQTDKEFCGGFVATILRTVWVSPQFLGHLSSKFLWLLQYTSLANCRRSSKSEIDPFIWSTKLKALSVAMVISMFTGLVSVSSDDSDSFMLRNMVCDL